ncbi:group 2 truncated hemoglobin GlbO [Abditibacteriota bacterium]|nr:group 2 truncated hemoglobin GlbO [Abditibacteriota bacterium]
MISLTAKKDESEATIYDLAGGQEPLMRMVAHFYRGVESDSVLRPLYPEDLRESAWWTALFIIQYCGGPSDYAATRGHPRLRMRHYPFAIGRRERDAWVHHMSLAVEAEIENETAKKFLLDYFDRTATFLMNRSEAEDSATKAS